MEKRKISEENIFTRDHVEILKEIIISSESEITRISNDPKLTADKKINNSNFIKNN